MPSTFENELIEIYEREVEELALTKSKYNSILGASDVSAIVSAFRLALEHGVDKVTAQMLYDMVNDESREASNELFK